MKSVALEELLQEGYQPQITAGRWRRDIETPQQQQQQQQQADAVPAQSEAQTEYPNIPCEHDEPIRERMARWTETGIAKIDFEPKDCDPGYLNRMVDHRRRSGITYCGGDHRYTETRVRVNVKLMTNHHL